MLCSNPYILGASAASFKPSDIGGCVLWLRSDLGITKDGGDLVSAWADQSGQGNDFAQAVGDKQPLWVDAQINGYPDLRFDGVDDYLGKTTFALNQPMTFFIVMKNITPGAGGVNDALFGDTDGSPAFFSQDGGPYSYFWDGGGDYPAWVGIVANTVYSVVSGKFDTTVGNAGIYENGTLRDAGTTIGTAFDGLSLGAYGAGGRPTNISVAEVILYNSALSDANRILVENYLSGRYSQITVITPNGGEKLFRNEDYEITWDYVFCFGITNVKIELLKSGVVVDTIIASTLLADKSYVWSVPFDITIGEDYTIKISAI